MRAVVIEMDNKHMVVMKDDGTFEKVKKNSIVQIGDEISLGESKTDWGKINKYLGIAASIMLLLFGGIQVKEYYTPYGYMSIDINPSIELDFNKYERIIGTKGLNGDGIKVLQSTPSVQHSKIEDATRNIVETASRANYLKSDQDNNIMFTIYTPNTEKNASLNNKINTSVGQYLKLSGKRAELINEIASKEDLNRAALQKISAGKLKLYEKAKSVDPSITIEDIRNKPVRDIVKIIKSQKEQVKPNDNVIDDNMPNGNIPNENIPNINKFDDGYKQTKKGHKVSLDNTDISTADSQSAAAEVSHSNGTQNDGSSESTQAQVERQKDKKILRKERKLERDSDNNSFQENNDSETQAVSRDKAD